MYPGLSIYVIGIFRDCFIFCYVGGGDDWVLTCVTGKRTVVGKNWEHDEKKIKKSEVAGDQPEYLLRRHRINDLRQYEAGQRCE